MHRPSTPWHPAAFAVIALMAGTTYASEPQSVAPTSTEPVTLPTLAEAREILQTAAERDRERFKDLTFEAFKARVYREPFPDGKFIVNGDTPIAEEKQLQEFFENQVLKKPPLVENELIVHQVGGLDAIWNSATKRQLTYCVSQAFGNRHSQVVADLAAATGAWEAVADVDFAHLQEEDNRCNATNTAVVFDVRPVNVNGDYLARAFFPNEPRRSRNLLIDESSFRLPAGDKLTLVGILRHELGHALGFRHEHTRPTAGACFEDSDWRPLTDYDPFSVMHYPQCNGLGDWTLTLTERDRNGAACMYGPASGFSVDAAVCTPASPVTPPPVATTQIKTFGPDSVGLREEKRYGPFRVAPGTRFEAVMMGGSGDPDLYVRFGAEPETFAYDCRPYLSGPDERCTLDVPADQIAALIMVRGYRPGEYELKVTHTAPAQ